MRPTYYRPGYKIIKKKKKKKKKQGTKLPDIGRAATLCTKIPVLCFFSAIVGTPVLYLSALKSTMLHVPGFWSRINK